MNEALDRLAATDSEAAELVKLRFFGGLTSEQAAEALGVSTRTARSYLGLRSVLLAQATEERPELTRASGMPSEFFRRFLAENADRIRTIR